MCEGSLAVAQNSMADDAHMSTSESEEKFQALAKMGPQDSSPVAEVEGTTVPTRDNMVQSILQKGIKAVPAKFRLKSPIENHPCANGELRANNASLSSDPNSKLGQVPVIDLANWFSGDMELRDNLRDDIGRACHEWGFFQVVNHGVPQSVLQGGMRISKEFFDLPFDTKQQYAMKPGGFVGYGRVYEYTDKVMNWNDILAHILSPKSLNNMETEWPDKPSAYRDTIGEYQAHIQQLGTTLYEIISLSLELKPFHLSEVLEATEEHSTILRINLYPPCPEPEMALGTAPHSDGGIITILQQSVVPGLQIRPQGKPWVLVEPIPGALVVNVGDGLEVLTNGRYKSIEHRALVNNAKERFSLAVFFASPWHAVLAPLPELISEANAAHYGSIKFSDYFLEYFKKGPEGKSLVEALRFKPH